MKPVQLVFHRGDNRNAPENTFASAEKAIEAGADYIEFDVRQSADGVLYVLHDETVDRTTNGSGKIAEMNSAEIDDLDAGSWFGPEFAGEPVPRMEHFLRRLKGRVKLYCEIKDADVAAVVGLIREFGLEDEVFVGSFSQQIRDTLLLLASDIRRNIQIQVADGSIARAVGAEKAAIFEFMEDSVSEEGILAAKAAGLQTMVFIDTPNAELFAKLVEWQIDYVNLDYTALFRAVQHDVLLRHERDMAEAC
jgi:glycerophosphoryl diester phosphodiesterase